MDGKQMVKLDTGAEVPGAKGSVDADRFSVQANTMASDEVIARTAAALGTETRSLRGYRRYI